MNKESKSFRQVLFGATRALGNVVSSTSEPEESRRSMHSAVPWGRAPGSRGRGSEGNSFSAGMAGNGGVRICRLTGDEESNRRADGELRPGKSLSKSAMLIGATAAAAVVVPLPTCNRGRFGRRSSSSALSFATRLLSCSPEASDSNTTSRSSSFRLLASASVRFGAGLV